MNSSPGRLRGSGIRNLPEDRIGNMLQRIKVGGSGKSRRVQSVRYRVTGFRDPDSGGWISRNPRNGHYYLVADGRHRTRIRPSGDMIRRTDLVSLEVEVNRGGKHEPRIYYVSVPGL